VVSMIIFSYTTVPGSVREIFQVSQWMPETTQLVLSLIHIAFPYTYIPMTKVNLQTGCSKRLTITNKIEQLMYHNKNYECVLNMHFLFQLPCGR
jgi:hypothetical protein